jgi:hypothetical protein
MFKNSDLDQKGEVPAPFYFERFNFNPHEITGYFDRDPENCYIILP